MLKVNYEQMFYLVLCLTLSSDCVADSSNRAGFFPFSRRSVLRFFPIDVADRRKPRRTGLPIIRKGSQLLRYFRGFRF